MLRSPCLHPLYCEIHKQCIILDSGSLEDAYLPTISRHVFLMSWPLPLPSPPLPPAGQVNCVIDFGVNWLHMVASVSRLDTHPTHTVAQRYTHETMPCVLLFPHRLLHSSSTCAQQPSQHHIYTCFQTLVRKCGNYVLVSWEVCFVLELPSDGIDMYMLLPVCTYVTCLSIKGICKHFHIPKRGSEGSFTMTNTHTHTPVACVQCVSICPHSSVSV